MFVFLKRHLSRLSESSLLLAVTVFIGVAHNQTFLGKVASIYPHQPGFQASVFIVLIALNVLLFNLISWPPLFKPVLSFFLLVSCLHAYFTDKFGIIIDDSMLRNILKTDTAEATDLFTPELALRVLTLGIFPILLITLIHLKPMSWRSRLLTKARDISISILVIVAALFSFNKTFASFLREQKPVRYYAVPTYSVYSFFKFFSESSASAGPLAPLGKDATIPPTDVDRELIIFVLGETARSDRFSLNGYSKKTNPRLESEQVFSFKNVHSCGTSTAQSVPCIFSVFGRNGFDHEKAENSENLLDVLLHTKRVNVLWRDNNSDSKGVAIRASYEDFKSPKVNTICDIECRDEGMLVGLKGYIDSRPSGDIFIVLHQMGNHGPAYFKRYPKRFEVFKPACKSNNLGDCSRDEINNAYDNAILYTDYFLSKTIHLLKNYDTRFETAMFYVSDHGESLGENGIYLHGLPYAIAPLEQRKVPLIIWFGEHFLNDVDVPALRAKLGEYFTHDNVFHTLLNLMEIETSIYDSKKNLVELKDDHHH